MKSRTEMMELRRHIPYTLILLPMRPNERMEKVEPKDAKSKTLSMDESRVIPYTDTADPKRNNARSDRLEPRLAASNMDKDVPSRERP